MSRLRVEAFRAFGSAWDLKAPSRDPAQGLVEGFFQSSGS